MKRRTWHKFYLSGLILVLGAGIVWLLAARQQQRPGVADKADSVKITARPRGLATVALNYYNDYFTAEPAEINARWLELMDFHLASKSTQSSWLSLLQQSPRYGELTYLLPNPTALKELQQLAAERPVPAGIPGVRELGLQMLISLLADDRMAYEKHRQAAENLVLLLPEPSKYENRDSPIKATLLFALRELKRGTKSWTMAEQAKPAGKISYQVVDSGYQVPDLVTLRGQAAARIVLLRILKDPQRPIDGIEGSETCKLAVELVRSHLAELPQPPWGVVSCDPDLFPVLGRELRQRPQPMKASPAGAAAEPKSASDPYEQARLHFFRSLKGPANKARLVESLNALDCTTLVRLALQLPDEDSRTLALDTLAKKAAALSDAGQRTTCLYEAIERGAAGPAVVKLAAEQLADPTPLLPNHLDLGKVLLRFQLRRGKLAQAAQLLTKLAEIEHAASSGSPKHRFFDAPVAMLFGLHLARIGLAVGDNHLQQQGLKLATAYYTRRISLPDNSPDPHTPRWLAQLCTVMIEAQQWAETEALARGALDRGLAEQAADQPTLEAARLAEGANKCLVRLYSAAGRPHEAVEILDSSQYWLAQDLQALRGDGDFMLAALKALFEADKKAAAQRALERAISGEPDERYLDLYASKVGAAGLPFLDHLGRHCQAGTAVILRQAEILAESKRTAEALKLLEELRADPAMSNCRRCHSLAGLLHQNAGRSNDARRELQRAETRALIAEGDRLLKLDLLKQAAKRYQRALELETQLPEAHAGLGWIFENWGKLDKAAEHYRQLIETIDSAVVLISNLFPVGSSACCPGFWQSELATQVAINRLAAERRAGRSSPVLEYNLAEAYERLGDKQAAAAAFQRGVELEGEIVSPLGVSIAWRFTEGLAAHAAMELIDRALQASSDNYCRYIPPLSGWEQFLSPRLLWQISHRLVLERGPQRAGWYPLGGSTRKFGHLNPADDTPGLYESTPLSRYLPLRQLQLKILDL